MDFDCTACGACCAFSADWPVLRTEADHGPDGPGPEWTEDGHMRWTGTRCSALKGELGACVGCVIYPRRPQVCRDCAPGSVSCLVARRAHGLPVPEEPSPMDALLG